MTFKFFLIVLILTGSGWEVDETDGWQHTEQPNWKTCIERRDFFNGSYANYKTHRIAICRKIMQ